jgi:hypothetical protein
VTPYYGNRVFLHDLDVSDVLFILLKDLTFDLLNEAGGVLLELYGEQGEAVQLLQCRKPFFKDKILTLLGGFVCLIHVCESFQ